MARISFIEKVMQILGLFSLEKPEWGVGEAAYALDLPKSTTSELMASLAGQRLLTRTAKGRYRLGWRLFELSQNLLDTTEFRSEARRVMEELVGRWKETMHLAVLDGVQAVYIEKVQPTPAVRIRITRAGARLPAHSSAVGKVLLAHCEWEYVAERLEDQGVPALTSNTITELDALAEEVEQVREQGYAYDDEETLVGLCCVGAPIYGPEETMVASISFSVPAFRFHPKKDEYTVAVLEAAQRISENASTTLKEYPTKAEEERNKPKTRRK